MKNRLLLFVVLLFNQILAIGQDLKDPKGILLQKLAASIQTDSLLDDRMKSDSIFTKKLVGVLKNEHSFDFDFDSLKSIKHLVSPDKKFKIFTWQVDLGDGTYRQRGAIQMNTTDGKLLLYPLFDQSDFVPNISLGVNDRKHWVGAIYYNIIPVLSNKDTLYTLLGYDENTNGITRKIIEVLRFEHNEPVFGGDYFDYPKDPVFPMGPVDRFVYQYKKGSNARIEFLTDKKMIALSELTSLDKDLTQPNTLVPSGNDLYLKWVNGKWTMIN